MNAAEFVVRLIDRASAPARRIAASMKGVEKALKPIKNNAAFKALDKAGDKMFSIAKQGALLAGVVGVGVAGGLAVAAVKSAMFTENTELAFEQLTHSAAGGKKAFETVTGLVGDLGLDLHDTTEGMRKLLAAQFSLGESTELIKMSSDLSAIGIHGEEAGRVLMALTQIKAKGKVQQEELLQLAEAGVSLELVMGQLQKTLSKTPAEVEKLQQAGKISGQIGIDAIKAAVKQKLGITEFGQARTKFINQNLSGMLEQLKSTGQLLFLKLGDSIKEAAVAMGPLVKETTEWVKSLDTSNLTQIVVDVLDTVRKLVPLGMQFIKGFVQGLAGLGDKFKVDIDGESLIAAANAGRQFAEAIGMVLELARMAAKALLFFTTPVGKVVAGFGLFAVAAVKIIGVVSTIASVIGPLSSLFGGVAGAVVAAAAAIGAAPLLIIAAVVAAGAALFIFWDDINRFLEGVPNRILELGIMVAKGIGMVALAVVAAPVAIGVALYAWWDEINAFFGGIPAQMAQFGRDMVMGLVNGVIGLLPTVGDTMKAIGRGALDATKFVLGIHSPSKEFEWLGEQSALGFAQGLESMTANTNAFAPSASSTAAAADTSLSSMAMEPSAPQVNAPIVINISGADDPKSVAQTVKEVLEAHLAMTLERLTSPSPQAA